MGHTWREMDPEGAARQDKQMGKLHAIRDKLRHKKLSSFEAEDVPYLASLYKFISLPSSEEATRHLSDKYG